MNRYVTTFMNHPFHSSFSNLQTLRSSIEITQFQDESIIIELKRMDKVISLISTIVEDADAELCAAATLNNLNSHFTNSFNNLTNFVDSKNIAHITSANDHLSNTLPLIYQIEKFKTSTSIRSASMHASNFSRAVDSIIETFADTVTNMESGAQEVNDKNNILSQTIDKQTVRLDTVITELQQKFLSAQENRSDEFSTFLEESKEKRAELTETAKKDIAGFLDVLKEDYGEQYTKFSDESSKKMDEVITTTEKVKKYFRIMTNVGTSGQFSKYASRESRFSLVYNSIGILFMAVAIYLSYSILVINGYENDIAKTLSRVITISLFFVPATYSVKEGAKHRKKELYFRKMELELATIDTFIENLSPENREDLKKEITRKLFGANDLELDLTELKSKKKSGDLTVNDAVDFLKDIGIKKESVIELFKMLKDVR